jgi:hypothetical protein
MAGRPCDGIREESLNKLAVLGLQLIPDHQDVAPRRQRMQ